MRPQSRGVRANLMVTIWPTVLCGRVSCASGAPRGTANGREEAGRGISISLRNPRRLGDLAASAGDVTPTTHAAARRMALSLHRVRNVYSPLSAPCRVKNPTASIALRTHHAGAYHHGEFLLCTPCAIAANPRACRLPPPATTVQLSPSTLARHYALNLAISCNLPHAISTNTCFATGLLPPGAPPHPSPTPTGGNPYSPTHPHLHPHPTHPHLHTHPHPTHTHTHHPTHPHTSTPRWCSRQCRSLQGATLCLCSAGCTWKRRTSRRTATSLELSPGEVASRWPSACRCGTCSTMMCCMRGTCARCWSRRARQTPPASASCW